MMQSKWMVGFIVILVWLIGCAAPSPSPQQQALARLAVQEKKPDLDQLILVQGARLGQTSQDYHLGPEDLLEITVYDQNDLTRMVRVNGNGEITLPLIGVVKIVDLTPRQLEDRLQKLYGARYLKNPQINVFVKEYRHQKIAVTGAVKKPGYYEMIGPRTLLEMLAMAGGLDDKAGEMAHIIRPAKSSPTVQAASTRQSFTPGTETIVVDLNRLLVKGAGELNLPIHSGDVIHVPFAQTVYVLGAVSKPGGVFLKDNMTVTKAIAQAGGLQIMLASDNATVLRMDENGQRQTIQVNIGQVVKGNTADVPLRENDIVFVQESPVRRFLFDFKMLIPGSFGFSLPGMM
jgi:polysaccharide export outer membrane protein